LGELFFLLSFCGFLTLGSKKAFHLAISLQLLISVSIKNLPEKWAIDLNGYFSEEDTKKYQAYKKY
jgi:hypothetical protein